MALPGWVYISVAVHVIITLIFVCSLLYYHIKSNTVAVKIATKLEQYLKEFGYDAAPFLVEWYNDLSTVVKLDYPPKTVCVSVLSNAEMFDKTLPAFLKECDPELKMSSDHVDNCTKHYISKAIRDSFPDEDVDIIYDWELQTNSRLPKVNMPTAGHAAGLAYFNRPEEITEKAWEKKMYGCSVSPKYGGWFGYRAVIVFKNITDDTIQYMAPHDAVGSQELKIKLLEQFNGDWKDPAWRDIICTDKRYSDDQIEYFNILPAERLPKLKQILENCFSETEEGEEEEGKKDI